MLPPIGTTAARIRALFTPRIIRTLAALGLALLLSAVALPASADSVIASGPASGPASGGHAAEQGLATTLTGRLTVDCVVKGDGGAYRAVFGYDNNMSKAVTVPVGVSNYVTPDSLNGDQPTKFEPGAHRGAFTTQETKLPAITWRVGLYTVIATPYSTACTGPVDLPAEGNGAGPAIVILLSLGVVAVAAGLLYRRHKSA